MKEFLEQEHAENHYVAGTDISDSYNEWTIELGVDDWIELAESYAVSGYVSLTSDNLPF